MNLYGIKDISTGKLVTGITNPSHKFWERRTACQTALRNYIYSCRFSERGDYARENYKVVKFELKEVENEENI